jgi:hypothetical protein
VRCRMKVSAAAHPYALAYHMAGHAVVLEHLDVPIISVRVHARKRTAVLHALMVHRDPAGSRMLVERDVVCALAGVTAQLRGCGRASWFSAFEDCATATKRLERFTRDESERAAWNIYLRERARAEVNEWWHEVTVVAAVLLREGLLNGASLGATLAAFRANPFCRELRPLQPIPWQYPAPESGRREVELIYTKPKLSGLIARIGG